MELVAAKVGDVEVLKRMLFATSYLPSDVPHYWNIVATFSVVALACTWAASCTNNNVLITLGEPFYSSSVA